MEVNVARIADALERIATAIEEAPFVDTNCIADALERFNDTGIKVFGDIRTEG